MTNIRQAMSTRQIDSWLVERFAQVADETYRHFNARVVATVGPERMMGVRTPDQRRIAREAERLNGIDSWLDALPHRLFEATQVHAFIICRMHDYGTCIRRIDQLLPHIDNWATCDQMSPKVLAKRPDETCTHALRWMASAHTAASRAPVAPRRCPVMDFVEEMLICRACSPNTSLNAFVSMASFMRVDVPCALM